MVPERALELAKKFEGLRLSSYKCPAGIWTIGYGHTGDVKPGQKISEEQAETLLQVDMIKAVNSALKYCPILALDQNKLASIGDFVFNLGEGRLKISTLRRRINEQNWSEARRELAKWVWGGGRKLPGLVLRRKAESILLAVS